MTEIWTGSTLDLLKESPVDLSESGSLLDLSVLKRSSSLVLNELQEDISLQLSESGVESTESFLDLDSCWELLASEKEDDERL